MPHYESDHKKDAPDAGEVLAELNSREYGKYVYSGRWDRGGDDFFSRWKDQIDENDHMYRGEWTHLWPNGVAEQVKPVVTNLNQVALDDLGRLTVEVLPQISCDPGGNTQDLIEEAYLRQATLYTYSFVNDAEALNHLEGLDLGQTGLALESVAMYPDDDYPTFTRIDPRGAYPRFFNEQLIDCVVVQRLPIDMAKAAFRDELAEYFESDEVSRCKVVEVIDWYDTTNVVRVLSLYDDKQISRDKGFASNVTNVWEHGAVNQQKKPCIPLAWGKMKTGDGAFRGLFDQIKGVSMAQNRLLQLAVSYSEQLVYSPFFAFDIENDKDKPGPSTIYRGRSENAKMIRIPPAGTNPEVFSIMEYLERQARAGANFPAQRGGEVHQSIASASFINSSLGSLTTMVKAVQKEVARLWQRRNALALMFDEKVSAASGKSDVEKTLHVTSGEFRSYKPSQIKGRYVNRVTYGAGAGLDALNKKQALAQDVTLGLASKETAREQTDYMLDPGGESQKVAKEMVSEAILQRLLTDQQVGADMLMRFAMLLETGMSVTKAAAELASDAEQERVAREAAAQAAAASAGTPPGAPGAAAEAPAGMQNPAGMPAGPPGAAPAGAGGEYTPPNQPLANVIIKQPGT